MDFAAFHRLHIVNSCIALTRTQYCLQLTSKRIVEVLDILPQKQRCLKCFITSHRWPPLSVVVVPVTGLVTSFLVHFTRCLRIHHRTKDIFIRRMKDVAFL